MTSWAERDLGFLPRWEGTSSKRQGVTVGHRAAPCDLGISGHPPSRCVSPDGGLEDGVWLIMDPKHKGASGRAGERGSVLLLFRK